MAINYARQFNRHITPQSQPIPGSTQVRKSGGGFSWKVDDWTRLDRFHILGAEGGTYYITEQNLVKQNHESIVRCIKVDGVRAVNRIVEISDAGRAPKNDPAIFALALAVTHGDVQAKAHAFANLNKVCRIGTHLFHFAEYVNNMRGWGRGPRNAVGDWYVYRDADDLTHQAVKYQQREGWSHSDLLRLAHPKAPSAQHESVFRWMLAGADSLGEREVKRKVRGEDRVAKYGAVGALPMVWAARNKLNVSAFITYTDSETWAGNIHPAKALRQCRDEFVGDAKAVVVGMTSNGFTLADPNERGMLDVVGFDTTVPAVIADFVRE